MSNSNPTSRSTGINAATPSIEAKNYDIAILIVAGATLLALAVSGYALVMGIGI